MPVRQRQEVQEVLRQVMSAIRTFVATVRLKWVAVIVGEQRT